MSADFEESTRQKAWALIAQQRSHAAALKRCAMEIAAAERDGVACMVRWWNEVMRAVSRLEEEQHGAAPALVVPDTGGSAARRPAPPTGK